MANKDKIVEGLKDATAFARGEDVRARVTTPSLVMQLRGCVNYGAALPVNARVLQLMAEAACEIERLRGALDAIAGGLEVDYPCDIARLALQPST